MADRPSPLVGCPGSLWANVSGLAVVQATSLATALGHHRSYVAQCIPFLPGRGAQDRIGPGRSGVVRDGQRTKLLGRKEKQWLLTLVASLRGSSSVRLPAGWPARS